MTAIVNEWFDKNKLTLNLTKYKIVFFQEENHYL